MGLAESSLFKKLLDRSIDGREQQVYSVLLARHSVIDSGEKKKKERKKGKKNF